MNQNSSAVDIVGVGFGPAGISLACAMADLKEEGGRDLFGSLKFLEKSREPAWHPELLLPGTDINNHVFRDLVTPRNPRSRFSFAMYLKEKNRLYKFGLLGKSVSRQEWSGYIAWAARHFDRHVAYEEALLEVLPGIVDGRLRHLEVVTQKRTIQAGTVIMSSGSVPRIPPLFAGDLGPRVFHTSEYVTNVKRLEDLGAHRWLVIGSGQSASDVTMDLLNRQSGHSVQSLHRSSGFKLSQFGQFPNLMYSPERVDYFHSLGQEERNHLFHEIMATNYAGVDVNDSQALYSAVYEGEISGNQRLELHVYKELVDVDVSSSGVRVVIKDSYSNASHAMEVDAIILATGYRQPLVPPALVAMQPWLCRGSDGGLVIDREYRVRMTVDGGPHIYANGLSERTHGISDAQSFSLMALRSDRIVRALVSGTGAPAGGSSFPGPP